MQDMVRLLILQIQHHRYLIYQLMNGRRNFVDLSTSQWIVDLSTINDGDLQMRFLMNNAMGSNIVQPNYVRLILPGNPIIKKPDSMLTLRSGASYT